MGQPIRYSHQREAIVSFLRERKDHPTADVVYNNIKQLIPNISLGTVYRNLNQLADAGVILRLACDGKTDHFDGCTKPHSHFMCRKCGAVKDIDADFTDELTKLASSLSPDHIDGVSVLFYGFCMDCGQNI